MSYDPADLSAEGLIKRLQFSLSKTDDPYGIGAEQEPAPSRARPVERIVRGGRVLFYPAAEGVVRIVGLGPSDEWIAEFSCRELDFQEAYLRRMERMVARK